MERVQALIHKLAEQQKNGASPEQLLVTAQLLQKELNSKVVKTSVANTGKVTVIIPAASMHFSPRQDVEQKEEEKEVFELNMPENALYEEEEEETKPVIETKPVEVKNEETQPYAIKRPSVIEEKYAPKPIDAPKPEVINPAFNLVEEAPTVLQQAPQKEVHQIISEQKESLNDKLKQEKTEVAHVLTGSPIKDLRKAIGVNDKFLFLNELFRGDVAMYERSLKTINAFHILPEAEYWINRELKVKLGWNDTNETVQHFYQLVRRRFS
ncbi:MAG: hypothetical protein C4329_05695 [Chitinophagaceae bacterium]